MFSLRLHHFGGLQSRAKEMLGKFLGGLFGATAPIRHQEQLKANYAAPVGAPSSSDDLVWRAARLLDRSPQMGALRKAWGDPVDPRKVKASNYVVVVHGGIDDIPKQFADRCRDELKRCGGQKLQVAWDSPFRADGYVKALGEQIERELGRSAGAGRAADFEFVFVSHVFLDRHVADARADIDAFVRCVLDRETPWRAPVVFLLEFTGLSREQLSAMNQSLEIGGRMERASCPVKSYVEQVRDAYAGDDRVVFASDLELIDIGHIRDWAGQLARDYSDVEDEIYRLVSAPIRQERKPMSNVWYDVFDKEDVRLKLNSALARCQWGRNR